MSGYIPPVASVADTILSGPAYSLGIISLSQLHPVLQPFDGAGGVLILPPASPAIMVTRAARWDRVSSHPMAKTTLASTSGLARDVLASSNFSAASKLVDNTRQGAWEQNVYFDQYASYPWQYKFDLKRTTTAALYAGGFARDTAAETHWDQSVHASDAGSALSYLHPGSKDNAAQINHTTTRPHQVEQGAPAFVEGVVAVLDAPYNPATLTLSDLDPLLLGKYIQPSTIKYQPPDPIRYYRPKDHRMGSHYGMVARVDDFVSYPWGRGQYYRKHREWGIEYPTYNGPIGKQEPDQPEIKLSYIIMNTISVVKLPEATPLDVRDISIDLDIDSWAWTMTGTVRGNASLNQVKPTATGLTDIRVTINGHAWVFMIERYTGDRTIGNDIYRIQGVSRTQYLAGPYAPKRSFINGSSINAKQAMEDELIGTGFTLEWITVGDEETPNWNIPAGALAYTDKTPLEVVKWIADAAGAIVYPAPDADTLTIRPRYPTPPWQIDTATMDRVITASMVRSISEEWIPGALYNAAYVSGISLGRGTMVTRTGTAGDQPAPDTFSELQVAVECNQARGETIIATSGNRALYRMDLHIPESATAPGLIVPGYEVEYQGDETWRGYVVATSISASGPGAAPVWQQITIDRPLEHLPS